MASQNTSDELSRLRVVNADDEKIIAAAKWMPRLELVCEGKRCLLLGGHQTATNTIMVWCTCGAADCDHPEGSRLMALDSWVVEHCRGEDLAQYEDEEDEQDEEGGGGSDGGEHGGGDKLERLDAMVMEAAAVVRVAGNVLPKQVPLRQLLCNALVSQGGNKSLKGVHFWVYWYDQAIPRPQEREHRGIGVSWVPGPLARKELGVWYKARIVKCDATSGTVTVTYDVDGSQDSMLLMVAFTHFGIEPPTRGGRPVVLPDMSQVATLGMPGATKAAKAKLSTAKRSREELDDFLVPLPTSNSDQPPRPPPAKKTSTAAATAAAAAGSKAGGGEPAKKKVKAAAPAAGAASTAGGSTAGGSGSGAAGSGSVAAAKASGGGSSAAVVKPAPAAKPKPAPPAVSAAVAKPAAAAKKATAPAPAPAPAKPSAVAAAKPAAVAVKAAKRTEPVMAADSEDAEEEEEDDLEEDDQPLKKAPAPAPAPKPAAVQSQPAAKAPVKAAAATATAPAATAPKPSRPQPPTKPLAQPLQPQPQPSAATKSVPTTAVPATAAATAAAPAPAATPGPAPAPEFLQNEFEALPLAQASPDGAVRPPPVPLTADQRKALKAAAKSRSGFCRALSSKAEQFPVYAFNEVDAEQPPNFDYLPGPGGLEAEAGVTPYAEAVAADLAAAQMQPAVAAAVRELEDLASASKPRYGEACGRSYHLAVRQREEEEDAAAAGRGSSASASGAAAAAAAAGRRPPLSAAASYDASGRLLVTRPLGLHECSTSCRDALCRANMTLSMGLRRTLEVFRTPDRGWGLRCTEPLSPGDFVAPLAGRLVPAAQLLLRDQEAGVVQPSGPVTASSVLAAPGVVLLNHFFELWEAVYARGLTWCEAHVRTWQLPPNPLAAALADGSAYADLPRPAGGGGSSSGSSTPAAPASARRRPLGAMLAIDTRRAGNVARFVRHCYGRAGAGGPGAAAAAAGCGGSGGGSGGGPPALLLQPVLCGSHCRSPLLYCIGLYAARHVAAGEELTADWRAVSLVPLPGPPPPGSAAGAGAAAAPRR